MNLLLNDFLPWNDLICRNIVDWRRHDTDWEKTDRSRVLVKAPLFNKVYCQEDVQEIQQQKINDHRSISISSDRSKPLTVASRRGRHVPTWINTLKLFSAVSLGRQTRQSICSPSDCQIVAAVFCISLSKATGLTQKETSQCSNYTIPTLLTST